MKPILLLDTETTGLDPKVDVVVEVGVARIDPKHGKLIDAHSWITDGGKYGGEEVHGITKELILEHGASLESVVAHRLGTYSRGCECIVAHNADFDRQWFGEEAFELRWVDSIDLPWPRKPQGKSLTALALAHGVGIVSAHRALNDVLTLAMLFERAVELGADLEKMISDGLLPRSRWVADVPMSRNGELKQAGFRWDPEKKQWWKKATQQEASAWGFAAKEAA